MEIIPTKQFSLQLPNNGGCSVIMIGSGRSGKTTALGYLLHKYFSKHIGILMTNSPQANIYKDMDIIQAPKYCPKVFKDMYTINKNTNNHYQFLAVLDDVTTGIKFDKELQKALTIYRNSQISVIQNIQAITLLNTAGRTNATFVFLFKLNTDEQIEKAVKWYLSSYFPPNTKMADKIRYYRESTEDHYFFVIDSLNYNVFRTKINIDDE